MHSVSRIALIATLLLAFSVKVQAEEQLSTFRSKDAGITAFDLTATEVKREPGKSFLIVPGFKNRSAAGSRWLMCVYTALAIERGYDYWTVVYPEGEDETLIVEFPGSEAEDIGQTLGNEFSGPRAIPKHPASVKLMTDRLCGHSVRAERPTGP